MAVRIPKGKRFPTKWLQIGIRTEMEHTNHRATATRIAKQHLVEHPTYYQVLPGAEKFMAKLEKRQRRK